MKIPIRYPTLLVRICAYLSIAAFLSVFLPAIALATSADISLSGKEGAIPLQASATFTNHLFCDGNSPPNCWHDNSGNVSVTYHHPNGYTYYMGGQAGEGSATWSTKLDTGAMAQGTYTYTATACDSKSICISDSQSISIDNTPEVTAAAGSTEGDLDIKGTVDFKEHVGGAEGRIELWYLHPNGYRYFANRKYFEGAETINWTWQDIVGSIPDAGSWSQGEYTVQVIAIANNGATKQVDIPIAIDNTPEVTGSAGNTEGDLDINGTVDFKKHVGGAEGRIELWYLHPNGYRYFANRKYYEGSGTINWTWQDIVGSIPDAGTWSQGKYTIQVFAIANNGATKQVDIPITIDNTPEVTGTAGNTEGDLDISGTVDFKEYVGGAEGHIDLWYLHPNGYRYFANRKYFEGSESINWTWQDIVGSIPDAGTWSQGKYTIQVFAIANNGATKQFDIPITIDNTPEVTGTAGNIEGDLEIKGTVDFKEHVGGAGGRIDLWYLHPNGYRYFANRKYFEGSESINWTWQDIVGSIPDAGSWSQGKYTIQVFAIANNGATKQVDIPITIDNTPEVTGTAGNTEGDLEIKGTVDFKEHVGGAEGHIDLWYFHPNGYRYFANRKYYEGSDNINWSWQDIVGSTPNAGVWAQGRYTVQVIAIANNGATKQVEIPITVDNTPKPSIDTPPVDFPDKTTDITGTVLFKDNDDGYPNTADPEGSITLYIAQDMEIPVFSQHGSTKFYEGKRINWKYSEFTNTRLSQVTWGGREFLVKIVAKAANGATAEVVKNPLIPPNGCPYPPANQ